MLALLTTQRLALRSLACKNVGWSRYSSSKDDDGSSSSDDEKKPAKPTETAAQRLNRLLGSMQTTDQLTSSDFPLPGQANRRRREALKQEAASKNVLTAAQNIASMLGSTESEKKQTESELLSKLLGKSAVEATTPSEKDTSVTVSPDKELNLSELIVGMKIDRSPQPQAAEPSRGDYVRRTLAARGKPKHSDRPRPAQRKREAESFTGSVQLYGGEPLGIFKPTQAAADDTPDLLPTWEKLSLQELSLQAAHPPANYFEQVAQWTVQGKLWRFPIDNEQDMREEAEVDFSEHIFLEQHLVPWCPTRGPIRHFMELVCVGLAKNPYVTAQEKKEHILWFRDYFEAKKDILKDLMMREEQGVKKINA